MHDRLDMNRLETNSPHPPLTFRGSGFTNQTKGGEPMAYTPELSMTSSRTLRRVAWALDMPMTKAIEKVFEHLPEILDSEKVCRACRDKSKCSDCGFNSVKQIQDERR